MIANILNREEGYNISLLSYCGMFWQIITEPLYRYTYSSYRLFLLSYCTKGQDC